jgi:ketosteroid isomerase-like protein
LFLLLCVGILAGANAETRAQVRRTANADEAAIRAAAGEYAAAVRRGDRDAIKRMWTADGDYIDASGRQFKVHNLVEQKLAESPADSTSAAPSVPASSLRFITVDVAIEDGASELGATRDGDELTGRFTAVWVQRNGRWLLSSLREWVTSSSSSTNARLEPLAWLLGEWIGTSEDAVILLSSQWSGDGNYILREFLIRRDGHQDISASQRIGWDASAGEIKGWTFDSQGGSGEGRWQRDGERWIVESTEVTAEGKTTKTVAAYVPGGDGQFTSELKNASDNPRDQAAMPALRIEFRRAVEDE